MKPAAGGGGGGGGFFVKADKGITQREIVTRMDGGTLTASKLTMGNVSIDTSSLDKARAENEQLRKALLDIAFGDHKTDLSVVAYKALGGRVGEYGQLLDNRETLTGLPAQKAIEVPSDYKVFDLTGCAFDGGTAE
jgi:hypothetical protein